MRAKLPSQLLSVLALGTVSQVGQALVLRELLMVFHGNELAIGLILASWLFWGAVGCRTGTILVERSSNLSRLLFISVLLIAIALPVTILLIRGLRGFFDILPGASLSLADIAVSSFILTIPVCIPLGAQFVILTRIWRESEQSHDTSGASKTYIWEAAGHMIGGIVFTFVLVTYCTALQSAAVAAAFMVAAAMWHASTQKEASRRISRRLKIAIAVVPLVLFSLFPLLQRLDAWAYRMQWQQFAPLYELVSITQSKHGVITVARRDGQYSFFQSGHLIFSTAGPGASAPGLEEQEAAVFAHMAMAQHSDPRRVLLIGGGYRGTIAEMIKHPIETLDYIELDEQLSATALPRISPPTRLALDDPRVSLLHTDGRLFIKQAQHPYDMIIVDIPDPATAVLNRYYTVEFFREAEELLAADGVLVLGAGSAPDLRGLALVNRKATIYHTLNKVFSRVLPFGDRFMFFFAGNDPSQISLDPQVLENRYLSRNIVSDGFSSRQYHTIIRLPPTLRINWIVRNHGRAADAHIRGTETPPLFPGSIAEQEAIEDELPPVEQRFFINSDFRPIGYFYTLMYWEAATRDERGEILRHLLHVKPEWIAIPVVLALLMALGLRYAGRKRQSGCRYAVLLAVFTTGLSTMTLQVALLFAFQSVYGFVYEMVGLIVAIFMCGLAMGTTFTQRFIVDKTNLRILAILQLAMVFLAIIIAFILPLAAGMASPGMVFFCFSLLTLTAGILNGIDFPLAAACYLNLVRRPEKAAGVVYSLELAGSCIGATMASVLVAPIFGITACFALAAIGNGTAFIAIMITGKIYYAS